MVDAISSALSGLSVQKLRVSTAATNIANVSTSAPPESASVYKPLTVQVTSEAGGTARASVVPREGGSEVDLAEEAVTVMDAKTAYRANLAVLKVQEEMSREPLKD